MEKEESVENFRFEEWTIENFSVWNREIHGNVITTSKSYIVPEFVFELYPRGLSGKDERLVVIIRCSEPVTFSGELSYIGSVGSLLLTQQVDSGERRNDVTLPPGPKFKDVFSEIRNNQDLHGDRLTVRSRIRRYVDTRTTRRTKIDVFCVSFKISPKIFDDLDSKGKVISWILYPSGECDSGPLIIRISKGQMDCTKMILTLQPDPFKRNVLVHTRMSVLNNEDDVVGTEDNDHLFRDGEIWNFVKSLSTEEVACTSFILHFKIIPSNINKGYVSVCHYHKDAISLISTEIVPRVKNETNLFDSSLQNLSSELMCLYQDQDFSDFQLKCGNVSIPVHRAILSARSPVFKTMLSTDMKEAVSGCMDIVDLDPSTLGLFLTYLYTGAAKELQGESALKLYYVADKYEVPSLKMVCADFLSGNVSFSNVCDILSLANKHLDDQLTTAAHNFIVNNFNDVLSSEEWAKFIRNEPVLAVETVTHFAKKKYVSKNDTF